MLTVISPAKSLDMSETDLMATDPIWQDDAVRLAKTMRGQTLTQLKSLMSISDDLARLNRERFKAFSAKPDPATVKPAAFAFDGDTYQGLEAKTLEDADLSYAQDHLRILSGLYGLLRPLDAIQPYRLEMGSKLKTRRGKSLYAYWGDQIAKELNTQAHNIGSELLLNCASKEYFHAASTKALKLRVITPEFLEVKDDRPRMVSFFAKRARGAMARFAMTERVQNEMDLRAFSAGGYVFDSDLSEDGKPVFTRPYPETKS